MNMQIDLYWKYSGKEEELLISPLSTIFRQLLLDFMLKQGPVFRLEINDY